MNPTIYQFFFSANLAFILTNLYGWILKWFYRPKAYNEEFSRLFPAQRSVGWLYLLQILELPYLLHIGQSDALLYVNAFSLLIFSMLMLIMCDGYFFPHIIRKKREYLIFVPAIIVLLPLFLQAIGVISLPLCHRSVAFVLVSVLFIWYFCLTIMMALKIGRTIRLVNEAAYADTDDFPVRFARYIQWVPTFILLLLAVNFYADNIWVKFARDIIFIFANIWFCILTLNPWRKVFSRREEEIIEQMQQPEPVVSRLADDRFENLTRRLSDLLIKEQIFTEPHITSDTLMHHLGTNSTYLTEVIKRSGYQSFYDMINRHRVEMAIRLIQKRPDEKFVNIAEQCGFSSSAAMTRVFKQMGKNLPSDYRKSN